MRRNLTIPEAAERVGVGIRTIHRWFDRGLVRTRTRHLEGGRGHKFRVHVREDDLLEFDRQMRLADRALRDARQRRLDDLAAMRRERERAIIESAWAREATLWSAENPAIAFSTPGHMIDPRAGWCSCLSESDA